jgi:hypothetical protein
MMRQEYRVDPVAGGPCSECGLVVDCRLKSIDGFTHCTVQLCSACWNAHRQWQVFTAGCCG